MTGSAIQERPFTFRCAGAALLGIIHLPPQPARRGVLIVVGGPQYRVGSHRQLLLLARSLAERGIPAMRFDHRGIGDSEGPYLGFEDLGPDIAAAIDAFLAQCPGLEEIVLWGLCDAASAILFYAPQDPRVSGAVLLNPWVRTPEGEARTYLRHYYLRRLTEGDFWRGLLQGRFRPWRSATSLLSFLSRSWGRGADAYPEGTATPSVAGQPLPERMAASLARYRGQVLLIISGRDLTAREFESAAGRSPSWRGLLAEKRVQRHDLEPADHTFSRRAWRDKIADWTADWLQGW